MMKLCCAMMVFAGFLSGCQTLQPAKPMLPSDVPPEDAARVEGLFTEKKTNFVRLPETLPPLTAENTRMLVELDTQRVYLYTTDGLLAASKISSGRRRHRTEIGEYTIGQKSRNHRSNIYGKYVDAAGVTVMDDIDQRVDPLPEGASYMGASMANFLRLHRNGKSTPIGFHTGVLPGYPASHGCLRLPARASAFFFENMPMGASVIIHGEKYGTLPK